MTGLAVSPDGVHLQLRAEVTITLSKNLLNVELAQELAPVAAGLLSPASGSHTDRLLWKGHSIPPACRPIHA